MGISFRIGDCLDYLQSDIEQGVFYDAIVTDPPYETATYAMGWDSTGITFSSRLWRFFFQILKPGAFVAAFATPRFYHRLAVAAENVGLTVYPPLLWDYGLAGMPKPQNVSRLFDRDNIKDRKPIGYKPRCGYARSFVHYGSQQYTSMLTPIWGECESDEAKKWDGYYYGINCFKPSHEMILLAQKPIAHKRMIDNIREFGTGALNFGEISPWPTAVLRYRKASKAEHGTDHPTVKPVALMQRLCTLVCPQEGRILDPFAGTGTTGVAAASSGLACALIERNPEMEAVIERRCSSPPEPSSSGESVVATL